MAIRTGKTLSERGVGVGIALLSTLFMLCSCGQYYTGDPWSGQDPQWKRTHFETYAPDAQLRARAAYNQIDR